VTDRGGAERAQAGIDENIRFMQSIGRDWPSERLSGSFGLHASLTVSEETLERCRAAAWNDVGFHIHVAEHSVDEFDSLNKYGLRVIDRLNKYGILNSKTIIVHGVHLDAREIEILAESGAWLSHQPRSNMNNAVGLPAVADMIRMGVRVCLGNDGFSNAMWEEWKACYFSHKLLHRDPRWMAADTIAEMAIYNNRELVRALFGGMETGVIREGAKADLIFVDYKPFTEINSGNLPWHIIFGFHESMITATMADGKLLMKDGVFYTLDVDKIIAEARVQSSEVWGRYRSYFR
jgi:cytosine/adenosine deaminase-related metal-dependent hydrolase